MGIKTISTAAAAAAMLALTATAPAHAAVTLLVNYSDDASGYFLASQGDQFHLNGLNGSVTLQDGIAQDVDVLDVEQTLSCCWDDQTYSQVVTHTLTLNGVGNFFFSPWNVVDNFSPSSSIGSDGPVTYNVAGGVITVQMNAGSTGASSSDGSLGHYTASLLFNSSAVPETATWALMLTGMFGAGFALRRTRRLAPVA